MSKEKTSQLLNCARGCWQLEIVNALLNSKKNTITNPMFYLTGKAKTYSGRYQTSFNALMERIKKLGYNFKIVLGIRGGYYSATYQLIKF